MEITKLEYGKRNPGRVNIFTDNRFWLAVDISLIVQFGLRVGLEIDSQAIKDIVAAELQHKLFLQLYKWTQGRPHSFKEMHDRGRLLLRRWYPEMTKEQESELVSHALDKMRAAGFTDIGFAEWFVRERMRQGKTGKQKIKAELSAAGVDQHTIEATFAEIWASNAEQARATQLLRQKFGVERLEEIKDFKLKAKAYRWLVSRGFRVN